MKVHEALSAVMADVQAVGKGDVNKAQGWKFRGVDAVVNAVGPALRTHGVCIIPKVTSTSYRDVNNGKAHECIVEVEYTVVGSEGDTLTGSSIGESTDYSDKGTAQAMSVAYRTWWLQALCIPTDDPDPDETSIERVAPEPPDPARQAQRTLLVEIKARRPDLDDEDAKALARTVWDGHGSDPKRLNVMFAAIPEGDTND